jgi:anti-sigma factor RsiW
MHPETELIAYLRDELTAEARARVDAHLAACAECRAELDGFSGALHALRAGSPAPPDVAWPRYRAELRARLNARRRRGSWWGRPLPLALATALTAILVVLALEGPDRRDETLAFEDPALGHRLELLREYPVVERLDLLEDLDVIRQLDGLAGTREG